MLTTAETDFHVNRFRRAREKIAQVVRRSAYRERNGTFWQQFVEQAHFATVQGFRLAPAVKIALRPFVFVRHDLIQTAALNWSIRSVFSQEKWPSSVGVRPKWP